MYTVAYDNKDIVIRINKDAIDKRTLSSFLEFVEMEEIRRKSRLTSAKAASLAKEIKHNVWSRLKDTVLED